MTDTPPPGSHAAIEQGCKCPVMDNSFGKGYLGVSGVYVFSGDCTLHNPPKPQECRCKLEEITSKPQPWHYSMNCPIDAHWMARMDHDKRKEMFR